MPVYENHGNILRCTKGTRLHYFGHRHREIELILMLDGHSTALVDNVTYKLCPGDALIVFPNQLHQYISTEKEDYILFLIPSSVYNDYADSIEGHRPENPLIKGGAENRQIMTLADMCLAHSRIYAYQRHKCLVGAILAIILESLPLAKTDIVNSTLERILAYCEEHFTEDITLDSMSADLFLGKYYISHLFSGQLGISFSNYINALRIEEAVKLLATTDLSITEVCFSSGFTCTRTFNRAFVKRIGVSPRQYKANQQREFESHVERTKKS